MNALVCIESCEKMQFDVGLQQENTLVLSSVGLQKKRENRFSYMWSPKERIKVYLT